MLFHAAVKTSNNTAYTLRAYDLTLLDIAPVRSLRPSVAAAGINNVWIHMNCDTPEAIAVAWEKGMNLFYGTCAVMYLQEGFSYHPIHGWINKLVGKY